MLSSSDTDGEIQRALRSGAAGYVLKSMPQDELLAVIRSVHAGKRHVPAEVAAVLAEHLGDEDLTPRELEVLQLIRDGLQEQADRRSAVDLGEHRQLSHQEHRRQAWRERSHACRDDCGPPWVAGALIALDGPAENCRRAAGSWSGDSSVSAALRCVDHR